MTRQHAFSLLENLGYVYHAIRVLKHGNLVCGLSDVDYEVGTVLSEHGCHSRISRNGNFEEFYFSLIGRINDE